MPCFAVTTASARYETLVERGCLARLPEHIPPRTGRIFVVSTADVWALYSRAFTAAMQGRAFHLITFPGGESNKRMASVEVMAEEMVAHGGDRSSLVIAFGGGIVTDLAGFLAAVFMRGIPVIQIPTTLLAQVDAGVGGKTGANLVSGKNLIGAFHQPLAVLTDPDLLATLPGREYRAGIQEVVKCGVIRSASLFDLMRTRPADVLAKQPAVLEQMIAESVRIKCEVVSADEKEGGLRKILNFGHTAGHALEAETGYTHFLHGEAVGIGMKAAAHLSRLTGRLGRSDCQAIVDTVELYGPFPALGSLDAARVASHLKKDKKTLQGSVHFVLATSIGSTEVVSGIDDATVLEAIHLSLK
ncbi:MAG TPA: 3-dehydroquinate synthase [Bryobacteraceae bacterium]|nr:3-dehydroquinate synthase [Bryobacteraceae bacterium]